MPATIAPPPAPTQTAPAAPASPPAPPAPTKTIQVSQMPTTPDAGKPPPKGSAMDRMRQELAKRAKPPQGQAAEPSSQPAEAPKPTASKEPSEPTETPAPEGSSPNATGEDPSTPPSETPAPAPEADKGKIKTNPWKLVENYKARLTDLEKQVAEAKTSALAEQERKKFLERITAMENQNKELADEIRFVNYQKHPEFVEKYQKPYESAWKRAVSELSEIPVTDPNTGQARAATPDDLLALVNLPLGKAREVANGIFGDFADDVMAHRKEIRGLFEAQQQALENERKTGAERDKLRAEQMQAKQSEIAGFVKETFDREQGEIQKNEQLARYFTPTEGDDEGNKRLQKGFELVEKAFAANPFDPNLTPEQRSSAVRMHVALRNRAAAFGKLTHMLNQLQQQNAALAKELEQFKGSTPATGSTPTPPNQPAPPASAHDAVFAALRAKAKPLI